MAQNRWIASGEAEAGVDNMADIGYFVRLEKSQAIAAEESMEECYAEKPESTIGRFYWTPDSV